jgi:ferritin-like metal-binding protein YciE
LVDEVDVRTVLDAALIAAAQLVEHYEIARYDSLIAWAKELGRSDCASVLDKNLEEEKATSRKLTLIADARVNIPGATI